ncbi:MAG: hypothetical protein ACYTEY_17675, partial [Planctomycetota bacterium]
MASTAASTAPVYEKTRATDDGRGPPGARGLAAASPAAGIAIITKPSIIHSGFSTPARMISCGMEMSMIVPVT